MLDHPITMVVDAFAFESRPPLILLIMCKVPNIALVAILEPSSKLSVIADETVLYITFKDLKYQILVRVAHIEGTILIPLEWLEPDESGVASNEQTYLRVFGHCQVISRCFEFVEYLLAAGIDPYLHVDYVLIGYLLILKSEEGVVLAATRFHQLQVLNEIVGNKGNGVPVVFF